MEAVGRWGASGAAAVMIGRLVASLRTAMATAVLRELGGSAVGEEGGRENEMRALGIAGERWSVEAALWRVVACVVRATATRGHRGLHAAAMSWRRSATEDSRFSRFSSREEPPDSAFSKRFNR